MNELWTDVMGADVTWTSAVFKLLLSMILGSVIGLERRRKGQVAGLRTFALISMGATLAMLVSIYIPQEYMGLKNGDPGRIAAQVVSGVGFLGAGAIIQMKGSVRGLTTAAGIWMAACLGLAVGAGMFMIAIIATLLIIFILVNIERIERRNNMMWESKIIRIKAEGIVENFEEARRIMSSHGVKSGDEFYKYDYAEGTTIVNFLVRAKGEADIAGMFEQLREALHARSITLTNEMNL